MLTDDSDELDGPLELDELSMELAELLDDECESLEESELLDEPSQQRQPIVR